MTPAELDNLEINVLALRKIADKVLAQIAVEKSTAPARAKRRKNDDVAALMERVLTGKLKPQKAKK